MTALDAQACAEARPVTFRPALPLVFLAFTLLAILFFRPWLPYLSSALLGPPEDNMQDFWNSWHAATAHGWGDFFFTTQIRYPEGTSLSYHSFAWPQVAAVALLAKLFGSGFATLVLFHNLTLLATFPLSATGMFLLARYLLGDVETRDVGAALAGFVFAFNPWHVEQVMHHAHVANIEFLPLFVLFYLRALDEKRLGLVAGAAVMMALSALSCWYFLFYAAYFMVFQLLYASIRGKRWPAGWSLAAPILCLGGTALLLAPWLVEMLGFHPGLYPGGNLLVGDPLALVAFPPTHILAQAGRGIYGALTGNVWEDVLYLGLVNLAVLIWALSRKSDKRLLYFALAGMAFFLVIAAGDALHVWGRVTPLALPDMLLSKLPFFGNVRTPARAAVMVYLFLGLGVGQAGVMALRNHGPMARGIMTLTAILMLADFTPVNLEATAATCPAALDVIARDPGNFGVLDLPRGYIEGNNAMMLSACHGHAIVAGETSRKLGVTLVDRLVTADLAAQQRQLAAAHVKYVVLHKPRDALFHWKDGDGRLADYLRTYRREAQDGDMTVLRVY
jgi:hypothetical protein